MIPDHKKWLATALLFSGRQNPAWKLNTEQQKNWMLLWQHAPLCDKEVEQPAVLGYTGCRLYYNQHSHWQLYNGYVSFFEQGNAISKKDTDRQMELFLLNTAPDEVQTILREMKVV